MTTTKETKRPARLWFYLLAGFIPVAAALALMFIPTTPAGAQAITMDFGEGPTATGRVFQLILLLTVLSLAPSILVMTTSFIRIVVVLSFLRSALGLQQTPPNTVLVGLSLFLTMFIMSSVFETAYKDGLAPLIEDQISEEEALENAAAPFHEFMRKQVREKDLSLFMDMAKIEPVETVEDIPYKVLIPAFVISELRRAFEIGFLLFVPFLVIDMVVASILMSMGMMMLPPIIISLPFKLIFFVLVDGWYLVVGSLAQSFSQ